MKSLPLSPLFISFILRDFIGKTAAYKSCAKLVPRLFRAQQKKILVCKKFEFFFLLSAERPRYEFSATVLFRICKQRFSH